MLLRAVLKKLKNVLCSVYLKNSQCAVVHLLEKQSALRCICLKIRVHCGALILQRHEAHRAMAGKGRQNRKVITRKAEVGNGASNNKKGHHTDCKAKPPKKG
jgi:hypothetical protein